MPLPLFSSGTSRGGTTFFTRILSVNEQVKMASDPLLPLFRAFRDEIMLTEISKEFDITQPLDDFYYYKQKLIALKTIQKADLSLKFPPHKLIKLREQIEGRLGLAAKEFLGSSKDISGENFYDLFKSALTMMSNVYRAKNIKWCGFNDNWVIEFFPHLAREFEDSKFIVIIRDPRAAIASSLKLREKSPTLVPMVYSFAHSWRKHAAFAYKLITDKKYIDRLFLLKYEDFVADPENKLKEISEFLEIKFNKEMLIPNNFRPISGNKWETYSNFNVPSNQIYKDRINGWVEYLDRSSVEFIEFICGPEMSLFGYNNKVLDLNMSFDSFKNYFVMDSHQSVGWRGNHKDYTSEYENQLMRYNILSKKFKDSSSDEIIKYFLFVDVFKAIRGLNK
jgi:hypothetical protein